MQEPITIYWPSRLGLNGIADLTEGHLRAQVVSLGKEGKKKIISGSKGLDFYAKLWNGWTCPKTGKWYPIILSDSKEKLKGLKKLLLEKVATVVCFHFSLGFFSPPKKSQFVFWHLSPFWQKSHLFLLCLVSQVPPQKSNENSQNEMLSTFSVFLWTLHSCKLRNSLKNLFKISICHHILRDAIKMLLVVTLPV